MAAIGIIAIVSGIQWIVDGRKNFTGPRTSVDVFPGVDRDEVLEKETHEHCEHGEKERA